MSKPSCVFWTPTKISLEAFNTFGLNAKPNTTHPIGFFGTGLKYAVAVILRHGGVFRLFIEGVEYEFVTNKGDFRGTEVNRIRMRRRDNPLKRWVYAPLPFTTDLGKNWELWMAYRELASNTMDEGGEIFQDEAHVRSSGTTISIECAGFDDPAWVTGDKVFLHAKKAPFFQNLRMEVYDAPSEHIYYRGVRVYDVRYPSRFTYDFKQGHVELSEDRAARNPSMLMWYISQALMCQLQDRGMLMKALNRPKRELALHEDWFEGRELNFPADDYETTRVFRDVARSLSLRGFAAPSAHAYYSSFAARNSTNATKDIELSLSKLQWEAIVQAADAYPDAGDLLETALQRLKDQLSEA